MISQVLKTVFTYDDLEILLKYQYNFKTHLKPASLQLKVFGIMEMRYRSVSDHCCKKMVLIQTVVVLVS